MPPGVHRRSVKRRESEDEDDYVRQPQPKSAAELFRNAHQEVKQLGTLLSAQPPWSRDVENQRQKIRQLHLTILLHHAHSPHSQSLDTMWHQTTYPLITAYRTRITVADTKKQSPGQTQGAGSDRRKGQQGEHEELKRVLTRFRQVLGTEESFYRGLISRLANRYQLQDLAQHFLAVVNISRGTEDASLGEDHSLPRLRPEEKRDKLGLIYKALVFIGDLERYKEQYSDDVRLGRKALEERFVKAKDYYEVARALMPDDGSAFNQLAVIATYQKQDISTLYYYIRAFAIQQPFRDIEKIIDKYLAKTFNAWLEEENTAQGAERLTAEMLAAVAVVYRRQGSAQFSTIRRSVLSLLASLTADRQLPAQFVAKLLTITIGAHWHARAQASLTPPTNGQSDAVLSKDSEKKRRSETLAIDLLLSVSNTFMTIASSELVQSLAGHGRNGVNDSAIDDADDEAGYDRITAVVRRLLPSLRILSKWLKVNLDYLDRLSCTPDAGSTQIIGEFWSTYREFAANLVGLFPIESLPRIGAPLEEDVDMRGFIPVARGFMSKTSPTNESVDHPAHPNEEQLMRIGDILGDVQLIIQTEAGIRGMNLQPENAGPSANAASSAEQTIDPELTSEFDEDPVDMAVRVGLGEASSKQILRAPQPVQAQASDSQRLSNGQQDPSASVGQYSAFDLLQGIIEAQPGATPQAQSKSSAAASPHTPQYGYTSGGSIWTMSREESEKGKQRGSVSQAPLAHVAGLWGTPEAATRSGSNSPSRLQPSGYHAPQFHPPALNQSWAAHQAPQESARLNQPVPAPYWMALDDVPAPKTQSRAPDLSVPTGFQQRAPYGPGRHT